MLYYNYLQDVAQSRASTSPVESIFRIKFLRYMAPVCSLIHRFSFMAKSSHI